MDEIATMNEAGFPSNKINTFNDAALKWPTITIMSWKKKTKKNDYSNEIQAKPIRIVFRLVTKDKMSKEKQRWALQVNFASRQAIAD